VTAAEQGDEMRGYLGEFSPDETEMLNINATTPAQWALLWIEKYDGIDGECHKQWVIDQIAQILHGTPVIVTVAKWENGHTEHRYCLGAPSAAYDAWVENMNGDGEYDYDHGIAP